MEQSSLPRRRLFGGLLALAGSLLGRRAEAQPAASADRQMGQPLTTHMRRGEPPAQPLDTMLLYERGDEHNDPKHNGTREVLSLIHQERGRYAYPWTIYASLEAHQEEGDACVLCSRLHKHGPGWSSGLHSEVFTHARAVALGVNVEMTNDYAGTEAQQVIGVNIQGLKSPKPMQHGIQIHGEGEFETGIGLNGHGNVGLDLAGKYGVGIDARANTIRVNEGTCIELDGKGAIKLRYLNGRIEFLNGERCFGHLDVNGADHAL